MTIKDLIEKYDLYYDAEVYDNSIITTLGSGGSKFCIKSPYNDLDAEILDWDANTYILYEIMPRVESYSQKRWNYLRTTEYTRFERVWFQKSKELLTQKDIDYYKNGILSFIKILKQIFGKEFFDDLKQIQTKYDYIEEEDIYQFLKPSLN